MEAEFRHYNIVHWDTNKYLTQSGLNSRADGLTLKAKGSELVQLLGLLQWRSHFIRTMTCFIFFFIVVPCFCLALNSLSSSGFPIPDYTVRERKQACNLKSPLGDYTKVAQSGRMRWWDWIVRKLSLPWIIANRKRWSCELQAPVQDILTTVIPNTQWVVSNNRTNFITWLIQKWEVFFFLFLVY